MSRMIILALSLSCMLSQQQLSGSQQDRCCGFSRTELSCYKVVCLGCIGFCTLGIGTNIGRAIQVQHHDLQEIHSDLQALLQQMKISHASSLGFAPAPERVLMSDPEPIMPIGKLQKNIKKLNPAKKNN